ncbi:uncharacterized protein J7T54_005475 [Emericellopsis cladophorae]|uniref:Glucose-methanol-choline oxidoreductase N-terminal domain-containing protein n=1 Tax=Emericellopsis cladophorae TaxID=2686198 RepID=A0A9Q0B939_9HYPO|nr:uncharacterized protein J7T54_005475 [Emericellopsis cladophorae]KAI6777682.1 hypothetical protein J7T54_005475 [Emericellopsis cladophorae]
MGGVHNQVIDGLNEVDVIIAGGGTAGCVLAARLSDADPELSILVVERGPNNLDDPTVTNPLFFIENILGLGASNPRMMAYKGQAEEAIAGRAMTVPAGSILGGGSSINMLTYTRPQRGDLDDWNMPGWSSEGMIPYMKKDFDTNQAIQRNLRYISEDGVRQDAAHAYVHPRLHDGKHPNLHILVEHEVVRVSSEDGKANGVVLRGTPGIKDLTGTHEIAAKKLIVVSAGALGTPLLLERSGIGHRDKLTKAGIDVFSHVPGVGEEFQDHNTILLSYYTSLTANETYDDLLNGRTTFKDMLENDHDMLAWNAAEITSKIRPTEKEIDAILRGDARSVWDEIFEKNVNMPAATISTCNGFIGPIPEEDRSERFLSTGSFLLHPLARGHVHVTSSDPDAEIDLKTGILTDKAGFDLAMAMWLYKKQREIVRRLDVYRGEWPAIHPPFANDSAAVAKKRDGPLPTPVEDIEYSTEDDKVLEKWITENLAQNWHGIGTCKMASPCDGGVVDENLSVHGVGHLKIADLSIVPHNLAANTAIMAFTIGEKAADIIAKELKL